MKCLQKLYSSPSWLVASLCLLCTLFLTMISTNSVSATSVTCSLPAASSDESIASHCDTSSLDSSVDWYYSVSNFYISSNARYLYFGTSVANSINLPAKNGFQFSNIFTTTSDSVSFNYDFKDYVVVPSELSGSAVFFQHYTVYRGLSSFDLTISDVASSCPPVEPCPEIPEYPYTDQLDQIKQAIILVPAVCLVIYFFYAIYKMIMGGVRR